MVTIMLLLHILIRVLVLHAINHYQNGKLHAIQPFETHRQLRDHISKNGIDSDVVFYDKERYDGRESNSKRLESSKDPVEHEKIKREKDASDDDLYRRILIEGMDAAINNVSRDNNPYSQMPHNLIWHSGYNEGLRTTEPI